MRRQAICVVVLVTALFTTESLYGQLYPEQKHVRRGNRDYKKSNFPEAEESYRRALEVTPASASANFNLGTTLYRQDRIDEAIQHYSQSLDDPKATTESLAQALYNIGNCQFAKKDWDAAIEAYKQSLRLNPNDKQAKFNLAYAKLMKDDEEEQNNEGEGEGEGGGQDADSQQNQEQGDQSGEPQEQDQKPEDQKPEEGEGEGDSQKMNHQESQAPEGALNKQEADQLLDSEQNKEDKAKEKAAQRASQKVAPSGKNW